MADPERTAETVQSLRQRLRESWQRGVPLTVEELLATGVASLSEDDALALILNEFELRETHDHNKPIPADYCRRFPQWHAGLERLFAARAAMDGTFTEESEVQTKPADTKLPAPIDSVVNVGSRLGPYQLLEKLGEGGMGAVYQARHVKLDRLVALKVLPPHLLSRPDAVSRFEREMRAVGKLSHPNVVQALDAGEVGGIHYLSMEYVEGQDLLALVRTNGPMSIVGACDCIRQAALGLAAAHKVGLVHRDIKPSNLFITRETGQIKILDLGLALLSQEDASPLTSAGQCFGTADYMAPEQWDDAHACDGRADLYALGCTLFALLVGRVPFGGDEYRSMTRKMKGHVQDPAPDLRACRADVPVELDAIYRKLMAKKPEDRFATADALAAALLALISKHAESSSGSLAASTSDFSASSIHSTKLWAATPVDEMTSIATRERDPSGPSAVPTTPVIRGGGGRTVQFVVSGVAALLVLGGIFAITNRDGAPRKIEVSGDTSTEITPRVVAPTTPEIGLPLVPVEPVGASPAIAVVRNPPLLDEFSLEFDGWQNYVETPVVDDGKSSLTVEAWVTPQTVNNGAVAANRTESDGMYLGAYDYKWSLHVHSKDQQSKAARSRENVVPFQRTHIAAVYDHDEVRLYVAGRLASRIAIPLDELVVSRTPFFLGSMVQNREPNHQFRGLIHAVRFSKAALYTQDFIPSPHFEADDKTIALYRMEEGAGNILRDATGNGHDARIHCARWIEDGGQQIAGLLAQTPRLPDGRRWQVDTVAPFYPNGLDWHPEGSQISFAMGSLVRTQDAQTLAPLRFHSGHGSDVVGTRYSPDGKWLASFSLDATVRMWNIESGAAGPVLRSHLGGVTCLAWAPDSKRLASGGDFADNTICIWNLDGTLAASWVGMPRNGDLSWSPDGKLIAAQGVESFIKVWTLSGELVYQLQIEGSELICCAFSPDGKWLATAVHPSGTSESYLSLWSTETWQLIHSWPDQARVHYPNKLIWSPDSKRLFSIWQCAQVGTFDIEQGRWLTREHSENFYALARSPDSQELLFNENERLLKVCDANTGRTVRQFGFKSFENIRAAINPTDGQVSLVNSELYQFSQDGRLVSAGQGLSRAFDAQWSLDGERLAAGCEDSKVRFWNRDASPGPTLEGHTDVVETVSWLPDGQHLLSGSREGSIRQWHVSGEKKLLVQLDPGTIVQRVHCSPDGSRVLALTIGDGNLWHLRIFDATGTPLQELAIPAMPDDLAWDPTGQLIAAVVRESGRVYIWNATTAERVLEIQQDQLLPATLSWSPDGEWLAVAPSGHWSQQLSVRLWKRDGTPGPAIASGHGSRACWLDGGKTLVVAGWEWVDFYTFKPAGEAQPISSTVEHVRSVRFPTLPIWRSMFDAPRKRLYSWSTGTLQALDLETGKPLFAVLPLGNKRSVRIDATGRLDTEDPEIEKEFVYYIAEPDGSTTLLKPAEFRKVIGW